MKDELQKIIKGDVDDSQEAIASHSHDASLFEIRPEVVVYPKDADDVSELVKFVAEQKKIDPNISITPRSAGTCMAGGSLNNSISLDCMRYLNVIEEVKKVSPYSITPHFYGATPVTISGVATIGPGVYYRDFEKATLKENLLLPCFTASKGINALGGMMGNNSGGELSLKYGKTQDYVKSIEMVFADGSCEMLSEVPRAQAEHRASRPDFIGGVYKNILALIDSNRALIEQKRPHVSKNSAGYNIWNVSRIDEKTGTEMIDLSQLVIGAQGTLGVVTSADIRLVTIKKYSSLLVLFLSDISNLAGIVQEALKVEPETVEAYDDKTIMLAVRFWFGFVKKLGFWGALKLGIQFIPEFKMMLGGMPKLVLLVECAGEHEDEVLARLARLNVNLAAFSEVHTRLVKDKSGAEKYWTIRRDSFALLREHFQGKRTAPFIDDVIVPPARLPEFIPEIRKILEKHKLSYNIHGHAGNGNFHIIPLIETDARLSEKMILEVSEEVYSLVIKFGGSITAEHNDGIIRTPYLADMFGPEMAGLFAQVKKIFDPQNIFNPGKKVGLTKKDIGKYLIHGK
jgi:FAD/FMN-containing dehydrogenase